MPEVTAEEILKIAYAIGAGFDEKTLTEIAQSLYKIRWVT